MIQTLLKKNTIVWLTLAFMTGIALFDYLPHLSGALALMLTCFATLALIWLKSEKSGVWLTIFCAIFFLLGLQIREDKVWKVNEFSLESDYKEGDLFRVKVLSISSSSKTWNKALAEVTGIYSDYRLKPVKETVLFYVNEQVKYLNIGDEMYVDSYLFPIKNKKNPGEFDNENYWRSKGVTQMAFLYPENFSTPVNHSHFLQKWFHQLDATLSQLFEDKLQPESVGIAKAIILGDRDHLDAETVRSFGNSGAMHVLAVSGLHVGLILAMLIFFFSKFPRWISRYQATVISLIIIWLYALLTGFSPSVLRAVVMFSLLTIAKLSGRNYSPMNVLAGSAFLLLLYDPMMLYDLGFQLSYLAMLGIFLGYKSVKNLFYFKTKVLRWLWEGTSVALAAQVFTLPLTLYCFHQFPNYFLLSNIGLMILTNIVLIVGVLFIVFHKIPFVNLAFIWALSILVLAMFYFVQWVDFLPGSVAKGFVLPVWQVMLLYGLILAVFILLQSQWKHKMKVSALATVVVCAFLVFQRMDQNQKNEFVIFNEATLTMALKIEGKMYCFYQNDEDIGKSIYLVENYEKTRSSEIEYVRLINDKVTRLKGNNLDFSCSFHQSYYTIHLNRKTIQLTTYTTPKNRDNRPDYFVYMPWIHLDSTFQHQLHEGAFVYPI